MTWDKTLSLRKRQTRALEKDISDNSSYCLLSLLCVRFCVYMMYDMLEVILQGTNYHPHFLRWESLDPEIYLNYYLN